MWALDFQHDPSATEPTAHALTDWCRFSCVATSYIDPGSPWQNPYVESFHCRLRDELLDVEEFSCLAEARGLIDDWREDYNQRRPHSSLAMKTPAVSAAHWTAAEAPTAARGHQTHPASLRSRQDARSALRRPVALSALAAVSARSCRAKRAHSAAPQCGSRQSVGSRAERRSPSVLYRSSNAAAGWRRALEALPRTQEGDSNPSTMSFEKNRSCTACRSSDGASSEVTASIASTTFM